MFIFTEWYYCYPIKNKLFMYELKCIKINTSIPKNNNYIRNESMLIPIFKYQPSILKEFWLKYKYYDKMTTAIIVNYFDLCKK